MRDHARVDVDGAAARSRLLALDIVRTAAILGMMAVHIAGTELRVDPTGPWRVLSLASGFAAGTFAVAAGVSLSLTNPDPPRTPWSRTARRGVVIFVLGLLIEPFSGGVLVILCTYGALFVIAAALRGLSGRALMALGAVLAVVWPVVSLAIRRRLDTPPELELSWELLRAADTPIALVTTLGRVLFLDGMYPVPTWLALALVAWGAHRSGWLAPPVRPRLTGVAAVLLVVGFGGAALVERAWHPREVVVSDLVAEGYPALRAQHLADHAFGVPSSDAWAGLLTAAHHSGTTFELVQILGVAATIFLLASVLEARARGPAAVLSWPGRIALTLYVGHLAFLWLLGWFWLAAPDPAMAAFWTVVVFWGFSFAFAAVLHDTRGPLESLVRTLSYAGTTVRPRSQSPGRRGGP